MALSGSALLMIVGFVIGPAYFFYCETFTGRTIEKASGRSIQLDLDPSMNPVGIQATGRPERVNRGFTAVLYQERRQVWQKSFSISAEKPGESPMWSSTTVVLGTVDVPSAGAYELLVSGSGTVELEIRRNVRRAHMGVVWTGVAMFFLGLLISVMGRRAEELKS